ncbi:ABC transporter substrate-binding protein [Agrobacterium sp. SOY23]|uniref:ABC transporter substrate-binding protein n=1 Tax=Agrobacterium sp. SOY23 TaxID=3014555 RepID=UPI0022B033A5|nr:ABC transporter substrate-binding protein [Agrobacterium sp. SOY23]MCZ4432968.1 ABC transporter substrate-binding protein [Agrobacterium sp. SOY23]
MHKFLWLAFAGLLSGLAFPALADITVKDLRDREVTIHEPARRILLGFNYEDYIAVAGTGAMERVVALSLTPWKDWRPEQYAAYVKAIPSISSLTDVGDTETGTFSVERAIAARPDLVILAAWQYDALGANADQLEAAGIPVVVIDYNAQTVDKHVRSTLLLGKVTGQEERAKELANGYRAAMDDILARAAKAGPSPKKIYVELGKKGPNEIGNTYGKGMWGGVIDMLGGVNIAKGQIENWGPLSPEYTLSAKPDIVVIAGSEWTGSPAAVLLGFNADKTLANDRLGAYFKRPGWADLPAVKNDEVHAIYHGGTRTLSDFIYVQYIAKLLYPEAFSDIDPGGEIERFYEKWLPVRAEGVFVLRHQPAGQ